MLTGTYNRLKLGGKDFPGGSVVKNLTANAGDPGSISGSQRSPGEGSGYLLQYSCLANSMDGEFINSRT